MENSSNFTLPTGDCDPFLDDIKCDIILGFRRALGVLSMLCCLFIIFIILLFKKYKFLSQRLILYLAIAAFFQVIGYVMGDYHIAHKASHGIHVGWCVFQGYWVLFFDWLSFLWVCCITFNIFWIVVFKTRTEKFEKFYIIIDLVVPIILCCFPFIGSSYGPAGLWCWISSHKYNAIYTTGVIFQLVLFYCPFLIISVVLIATQLTIFGIIKRRTKKFRGKYDPALDAQRKVWEEEIRPLMVFPWIYIAILIFPYINRIRLAAGFNDPASGANFFFWFMHSITLTLHGTVYALVFACDKQTLSRIRWSHIKAALIRWGGDKPVQEYEIEHSLHRETVRRKDHILKSNEVTLTSYSHEKSLEAASDEVEPITAYSPYTENGNE